MSIAALSFLSAFLETFFGSVLLDALVRPRALPRPRLLRGYGLLAGMVAALFGLFLALSGNPSVALALALAVQALLVLASNAKHAMLGEPLLFSDLALIGAVFRHPQFYLSAVRMWQRVAAGFIAVLLLAVIAWLSRADVVAHLAGLAFLGAGLGLLPVCLRLPAWRGLARTPDSAEDTRRLGLLPVLLVYWLRWRESQDPPPCPAVPRKAANTPPEHIVIIQCESFADPIELFGDPTLALPGLAAARQSAMQWGNLEVSGFGAYTMRTEYGVLFGRDEDALGFRRYDPFLTALGDATYALPARLANWRSLFVHPHDMRFYGRDRIMPAGGFAELVGESHFASPAPGEGRYVSDAAMREVILERMRACQQPSLLYAVTIENHGPWAPDARGGGSPDLVEGYMRLVRRGDAMLDDLTKGLGALGRPALLVFFGDHRPSIPGASTPPPAGTKGARHTPYVMIRLDAQGQPVPGDNRRVDLTPAQLHHAVLNCALGAPAV